MAEQKPCIQCGRAIDEYARACPYCNWWQSEPLPAARPAQVAGAPPQPATQYVPPVDNRARNKLIGIGALVALVILAFSVGAFFHGSEPAAAAEQEEVKSPAAPSTPSPRATVKLVPVADGGPATMADAPLNGIVPNAGATTTAPNDFTALPADQYAAAAAQQQAAQQQANGGLVDPRSISGAPYSAPAERSTAPRPAQQQPRRVAVVQTQPVPLYQPIPHVRVDREETAQLFLTVGTDGRVHDIDVARGVPGVMGPLVGSVQQWRFRPATQGGQAVSSRFSVAVTFKP